MSRLPHATPVDADAPGAAEKLLGIVRQTVLELRPHAAEGAPIGLHSVLDRDLGLDSLARVELWSRIEREFDVRLPEALFATADTPHDLLEALRAQAGVAVERARVAVPARVAGVTSVTVASPRPAPITLAAAWSGSRVGAQRTTRSRSMLNWPSPGVTSTVLPFQVLVNW